jgi:hypothetical protein
MAWAVVLQAYSLPEDPRRSGRAPALQDSGVPAPCPSMLGIAAGFVLAWLAATPTVPPASKSRFPVSGGRPNQSGDEASEASAKALQFMNPFVQ